MFNTKKPTESSGSEKSNGINGTTLIGKGTSLKGDISSNSDLRVDGHIEGNIICQAKIIIGSSGVVEGNIQGSQADIVGEVIGTIRVKELLQLRGECIVNGNIFAGKLHVEPTATFNGQCHMGANVVEMSGNEITTAAKAK